MTIAASPNETESLVAAALDQRDYDRALTRAIQGYGGEVLGFIAARVRDPNEAHEAFAWFAEDLWRSLPGFARHCSVRTWCYALARNAALRFLEREHNPRARAVSLSEVSRQSLLAVAQATRDSHEQRDARVAKLRASLREDEQTLLTLRVDRELSWKEVAQVMAFAGEPASEEDLTREAARLRQRFHVLKEKLRELAASLD